MTTVSILGSGLMARAIATRVLAGGGSVQVVGESAGDAARLAEELGETGRVTSGAVGDDLTGEIVVLAVPYAAAVPLATQYGERLAGKVVVDITNPINQATFADLLTPAGMSAAEEVAAAVPAGVPVVKAFNTVFPGPLREGHVSGQPLDVFIAGDDPTARATVARVVRAGGMRPLDVGDLARARALEWLGLLHVAMQFSRGTNFSSAIRVVDPA
jgi:predicted dinucleotide-binding enzyme